MTDTSPAGSGMPVVRKIGLSDLQFAFAQGARDFARAPVFGLMIAGLFTLGGIIIYLQLTLWESSWMILPLAVGFPLLGPFVVVGLYEVSHQLEDGNTPNWSGVLGRIFNPAQPPDTFDRLHRDLLFRYMVLSGTSGVCIVFRVVGDDKHLKFL